jgi:hypothetical protein
MRLNHIGIAEDARKKIGRDLPVDLCATELGDCSSRKTIAPTHTALSRYGCRSGAGFGPICDV